MSISRWLVSTDGQQYWSLLASIFLVLSLEAAMPRRQHPGLWRRRTVNLAVGFAGLVLLGALTGPILFGLRAVVGPLHLPALASLPVPTWLLIVVSILLIDLIAYTMHVISHSVPWLWRLHKLHHADTEFDTTTGLLHHPIEVVYSFAVQFAVLALLGLPLIAIGLYAGIARIYNLIVHSNIRLPPRLERVLRIALTTPDLHRVHHSLDMREGNSNFGTLVPWWDLAFGTYVAQPERGHERMQIGLPGHPPEAPLNVLQMLVLPFVDANPARPSSEAGPNRQHGC